MGERLVMGYWDCPYCDTIGIKGTIRECPNCGKPRGEGTRFYMKASSYEEVVATGEYLDDGESQTKGKGEDWKCSYCGGLNSVLETECISCGHARDDADEGYFEMRERVEAEKARRSSQEAVGGETPSSKGKADTLRERVSAVFSQNKKAFLVLVAAIAILVGGIVAFVPVQHDFHVTSKDWTFSVEIEQYRYVDDDGWTLPAGADLKYTASEVHHYDKVFDHYEEKTRSHQERVQSGSHVEYSYRDNGDGTFTEVSHTVPDYTYETVYETYRDPVYRDVPVYETRYYYKIWKWLYKETVTNSGNDDETPSYPKPNLGEDERIGQRQEVYRLHGYYDDDNETPVEIKTDAEKYSSLNVGDTVKVKTNVGNVFLSFVD